MNAKFPTIPDGGIDTMQEAAASCDRSVVIDSGPGTGKTCLVVERIRYLMGKGVDMSKVLALSYTKHAGEELKSVTGNLRRNIGQTLHSVGLTIILDKYIKDEKVRPGELLPIINETVQENLVTNIILNEGLDNVIDTDEACKFIIKMKKQGKRSVQLTNLVPNELRDIYRMYEQQTSDVGRIDYQEMILQAFEHLQNDSQFHDKWATKYEHVIVDELQHISKSQLDLLKILSFRAVFFGLGDENQNIYQYNNSLPNAVDVAKKTLAGGQGMTLGMNYRSTPLIISLSNDLINATDSAKEVSNSNGHISCSHHKTLEEEAGFVTSQITKLHSAGMRYSDMAVLYRFKSSSEKILNELIVGNIPVRSHEHDKPFTAQESHDYDLSINDWDYYGDPQSPNMRQNTSFNTEKTDMVTLSTVHGIRNYEFEHVFIVGAEQKLSSNALRENELIFAERRTLYVATTRARSNLHISYVADQATFPNDLTSTVRIIDLFPSTFRDKCEHVNFCPISEPGATTLNAQQQKAVVSTDPVLVLSGAGTGKTRVIVERIGWLLNQGVEPEAILAVTYTNKAANEMRSRIGARAATMLITTFHSFGLHLLREEHEAAGLPSDFSSLDNNGQRAMVRQILQDLEIPSPSDGGTSAQDALKFINGMKDKGDRLDGLHGHHDQELVKIFTEYEMRRIADGKVDFAEMLLRPLELLRDNEGVRSRWASRFRHVLIDELQDINQMQMEILKLLNNPKTVFFGVGDDDQSIYRFRGAMPRMLQIFASDFVGGNISRLEINYRSTNNILKLANAIIDQNDDRLDKSLKGVFEDGKLPTLTEYQDDEKEAKSVALHIAQLHKANISLGGMAVLYRNNVLADLVKESLHELEIAYKVLGSQPFQYRAEILTLIAYLRAATNPKDLDAISRSVNNPPRKFGQQSMENFMARVNAGTHPITALKACQHDGANQYMEVMRRINKYVTDKDLLGAVKAAAIDSRLQRYHAGRRERDRVESLDEAINITARYVAATSEPSLEGLLNRFKSKDEEISEDEDQVTLSTIHSAKGLEFEHVFLIGLEQSILKGWDVHSPASPAEAAEECRLLYVAVTRAKRELHMSYAAQRMKRGERSSAELTTLLRDVSTKLYKSEMDTQGVHELPSDDTTW